MARDRALVQYARFHQFKNKWSVYKSRNRMLRELGFESYAAYLASDLWARIRRKVMKYKGDGKGLCNKCGRPATQVHHSRYDRKTLLGESIKHLWPVCAECHQAAEVLMDGTKESLWLANTKLKTLTRTQKKMWRKVRVHDKQCEASLVDGSRCVIPAKSQHEGKYLCHVHHPNMRYQKRKRGEI